MMNIQYLNKSKKISKRRNHQQEKIIIRKRIMVNGKNISKIMIAKMKVEKMGIFFFRNDDNHFQVFIENLL